MRFPWYMLLVAEEEYEGLCFLIYMVLLYSDEEGEEEH